MSVQQEFADNVCRVLKDHQTELKQFQSLWDENKFREAYLLVDTLIRENSIETNAEFKRADENFYWDFVS